MFLFFVFLLIPGSGLFSQSSIIDTTFNGIGIVDTLNSTAVDYKSRPGILQLETGENENLARGKFAYIFYQGTLPADTGSRNALRLLDNNFSSPSYIQFPPLNLGGENGSYVMVDLQAVRTVKKVSLFTLGNNLNLRIRAFSVFAGEDSITMEKVYTETDNQIASPVANFNPIIARYIKLVVDVIPQNNATVITELQVFGEGFLPQGIYTSAVRTLPKNVNFGSVEYTGNRPAGTGIYFSFRSGSTPVVDTNWSNWSDEVTESGSLFSVFEPRGFLQYRVRLTTGVLVSPEIDEVRINYDTLNVVSTTDASISPQFSQVLREETFSLLLNAQFLPGDRGIDTITISTPSPAQLSGITINGQPAAYSSRVSASFITIAFNTTITTNAEIVIRLLTTPFQAVNPYRMTVSSKLVSDNPQRVDSKSSEQVEAWSIVTVGVPEKLIIRTTASPNPFTPNNDGRNDETYFQFFLGNIGEPGEYIGGQTRKLTIKIYDLTGRLVRDLYDSYDKAAAFISDNSIAWDGRDNGGRTVKPGVYLYQIYVESDNGGESVTKTVVVAY
ncbi:MAG: hypothetical protein FMNOHCHN_01216 [Ignavibacteriaceae bacterium]|nr:hypothetical protein [Ignavibacteriaceae bacterium]